MRNTGGMFEDLVARRMSEWRVRQSVPELQPPGRGEMRPVITISRELGSGGCEVATAAAASLGWTLWDSNLVDEVARSAHVRTQVVRSLDEHTRSEVLAMIEGLMGDGLEEMAYRRHLAQVVLTVGQHGGAVIVGRGANYLLPDAFNIRVVAPLANRARRVSAREGIPLADARRRCSECDRERADFVRRLFGKHISDPMDYDLVVNTAHLSPAAAAEMVMAGVRRLD